MRIKVFMPVLAVLALMSGSVVVMADQGPREMILKAVDRITERIEEDRQRLEDDPEYAREVVREEISDMVDFKRITRLVMARHFDRASREQKYRFLEVFRNSLINTYASGVTLYDGQNIRVAPAGEGDVRGDRARVKMEISTNKGEVIPVMYSLFRDEDGWKVENVIVNGLNLGKTFRSQFDQAMSRYEGDLDQVIENWSPDLDMDGPDEQGENPGSTATASRSASGSS